mgnify:CR=1 FL=1
MNGGTRVDTDAPGSDIATFVTLNPQLPPDLQQKAVDPLSLPGFSLPAGQNGLFSLSNDPGHRYLIETNPAFANLKQFLNSDYLLSRIGFNSDQTQRRLGIPQIGQGGQNLALEILQHQGDHLSVKAVALRCGYKSLRLFSADFQRQFGVLPSEVRHKPLSSRKPRSI